MPKRSPHWVNTPEFQAFWYQERRARARAAQPAFWLAFGALFVECAAVMVLQPKHDTSPAADVLWFGLGVFLLLGLRYSYKLLCNDLWQAREVERFKREWDQQHSSPAPERP